MKLYVSDLDGTLLNSSQELTQYSKEKLNYLIEQGVNFTIATARSRYSAWEHIKGLNMRLPIIFYGGQCIYDPITNVIIEEQNLDTELCVRILAEHERFNINPMIHTKIDGESKVYYRTLDSKGTQFYMESRRKANDNRFYQVDTYPVDKKTLIGTIVTVDTKEKLDPLYKHLTRNYDLEFSYYKDVYTGDYWLEIMDKKATKGDAVLCLKNLLNADEVIVFGDNYNDISMFNVADESCAVDNAAEDIKKCATHVICSNDDNGVVKYISSQEEV